MSRKFSYIITFGEKLEANGFKFGRTKAEHMECNSSGLKVGIMSWSKWNTIEQNDGFVVKCHNEDYRLSGDMILECCATIECHFD